MEQTAKTLQVLSTNSPFFGLEIPADVSVRRQVLADPSMIGDDTLVWARLKDGTPLVTAQEKLAVDCWFCFM